MASALRASGLQIGDRVAGVFRVCDGVSLAILTLDAAIVANSIGSVVIAIAVASIGGIFSSTATDMGTQVNVLSLYFDFFVNPLHGRAY